MKLRKETLLGIDRFLALVPAEIRQRGRNYLASGNVLKLECETPDQLYSAVVRGTLTYSVALEFTNQFWTSRCTCPMHYDCKHAVAAILELQQLALKEWAKTGEPLVPPPTKKTPRKIPQPSPTPLCVKLQTHLARDLNQAEGDYVRRVQTFYANAGNRPIMETDLALLASGRNVYNYWEPLNLWSKFPEDDFICWQYLAWEFRQRNFTSPEFMSSVTDFSLIEAEMAERARQKEIAHWQKWFRDFEATVPDADVSQLDLRLMLNADDARLQWRTELTSPFADLKQTQAKRFSDQFESGQLTLAPEALPLWGAVFKPGNYESWWVFKYVNASARPTLNRLLRLPLAPERIVTADGQPLVRVVEPLRLQLSEPTVEDANYEIALVKADGSPPPEFLCTLEGQPTLYFTENGLFTGPSAEALDWKLSRRIPAPALETNDGVRFLQASNIPLPEHLAPRLRTVLVNVTLTCELKPVFLSSTSEDIVICVLAKAPGLPAEKFTEEGWVTQSEKTVATKNNNNDATITVQDRGAQRHFPRVLAALGAKWDSYSGDWKLRVNKKTPEVFVPWLKALPLEIDLQLDAELASLRDEPVSGSVSLDLSESGQDWFDLKVVLKVGDTKLTQAELKLLLNARGGFVRLGKKGWRRLQFNLSAEEDEQLARLGLNAKDFSAEPQRFHALQLADAAAKKFLPAAQVEKIERRVSELKTRVAPAQPSAIRAEMRPYQTEGFHFLAYLTENRFGGVLADDMGLGKTLQTLAWLAWLRSKQTADAKKLAPSLVVCPKSVTDNWRAEAERFYADLRVHIWRGEPAEELVAAREKYDLIVINYSQLRYLSPAIAEVLWQAVILDEAQYIKNPDSQTAQAARALKADFRLALTGTPIENRLLDLWSIFNFAMPGALGNRAHFLKRFNSQDDPLARRRLAARVRPFLLRRTKNQVAKDLPDRVEEDLLCEMEGDQKMLYRAELKRARQLILGLKSPKQLNEERFNVLTSLLRLRQICCHPALVDETLRETESAKLAALEDLLEPLMEEGHKVLVFSQFVTMLDLLRDKMKQRGWPHFYLAGSTENRGELVKDFQSANGGAVFLISLKAGGFGLNLTAASYVVLFDPWWNPAVENQAIDRTHRIGQTSKVMAYRLLLRDSIEQKIRALQKQKASLMDDVLGEERFAQSLTLEDLRFLFAE